MGAGEVDGGAERAECLRRPRLAPAWDQREHREPGEACDLFALVALRELSGEVTEDGEQLGVDDQRDQEREQRVAGRRG